MKKRSVHSYPEKGFRPRCPVAKWLLCAILFVLLNPWSAISAADDTRTLSFRHLHTKEKLTVTYRINGSYDSDAMAKVNYFLRDFRSGDVHEIDPGLLDILYDVYIAVGGRGVYEVISGYRSPKTNEMLRKQGRGIARGSLHQKGLAIDVRLTGVDTADLRDAALELARGGVGYYRKSDFVHLDTGRVRRW